VRKIISNEEIETSANKILSKYHPSMELPVPVEDILELGLKVKIVLIPELAKLDGVDAFFSRDLSQLSIDKDQYDFYENRARFTFAHEIGHWVLHKKFIEKARDSKETWDSFILDEIKREPFEVEANRFAGYLLLPKDKLEKEYLALKANLLNDQLRNQPTPTDFVLAPYIAKPISKIFHVSENCAEIRLKNLFR